VDYIINPVSCQEGTPRHTAIADLTITARHEAGRLLMLWLLDRHAVACGIADGCGVTKALDVPGEKEMPQVLMLSETDNWKSGVNGYCDT
jgi:hypothetical protein